MGLQEHPDPQSSAMLEMSEFHTESPPGSPSGSQTSGREYKRELTPVQESPNELGEASPRGQSSTPRQSSLEGREAATSQSSGQQSSRKLGSGGAKPETQTGQQEAVEQADDKGSKKAEGKAKSGDRKHAGDTPSLGRTVTNAVQGLKQKLGPSSEKKAKVNIPLTSHHVL